jgi:hypothetical protein
MVFATRLTPRLRRSLRRLDDGTRPIAEVNRLLGAQAERSGVLRPSYEQVRRAVHSSRIERTPQRARIVVEVHVLPPAGPLVRLVRRLRLGRPAAPTLVTACHVLVRETSRAHTTRGAPGA